MPYFRRFTVGNLCCCAGNSPFCRLAVRNPASPGACRTSSAALHLAICSFGYFPVSLAARCLPLPQPSLGMRSSSRAAYLLGNLRTCAWRGIGSRPAFRRRRDLCGPRRLRRCIYERSQQELKDLREETLAGLSWLHLNHEDVASALRRTAVPHQQLLASALGLVYTAHSGKPQWPTMPSRAIAARAVPGDSASDIPTKRCHCQLPRWRGRRPHRPDLRPAAP